MKSKAAPEKSKPAPAPKKAPKAAESEVFLEFLRKVAGGHSSMEAARAALESLES